MTALRRRDLLCAAAALATVPALARADTDMVLLVGGPEGGFLDRWATLVIPTLGRVLASDAGLRRVLTGGLDGVTAANLLEAQAVPDGDTGALLPGAAGHAWLIGDSRVHFDPRSWIPLGAALTPSVIVGRRTPGATTLPDRPRVALVAAAAPDIAALLALSMLGLDPQPVWLPVEEAPAALAAGKVDVAMLRGRHMVDQIAALPADIHPFCALSGEDTPAHSDIADIAEVHLALRGAPPDGLAWQALKALAVASRVEAGLILPALTPAVRVAQWRQASDEAAATLTLTQAAMDAGVQLIGSGAAALFATMATDDATRAELRRFIGRLHRA